jgi:hypothetical protein
MSVSSTTNKIIYTGSGTTGPFDFDFVIYLASDLVVEKYTIATGATTTLTITTDYTVTIDPDGTGYVTAVAAVTSAYKLIIRRVLPLTQEIDYVEGDKFPAETHEEGLDRSRMVDQQLQEQIDRAVLQNPTVSTQITLPGAVEGSLLGWEGGTIVNKTASDLSAVVKATQAVAEAGIDDTTYMTPLQVKNEVQKSGAISIPVENLPVGTTANKIVQLDSNAKLPAVDGSLLTGISIPVKATGAEIDTGTDDAKFVTPKAIANSTIVKVGLGSSVDKTSSYGAQQATTDGYVEVYGIVNGGQHIKGYTDGNADPVLQKHEIYSGDAAYNVRGSFTMIVKKGNYWKVVSTGNVSSVLWTPIGN